MLSIIDGLFAWYGNNNFLAREDVRNNWMRIVNIPVESKLLEIVTENIF